MKLQDLLGSLGLNKKQKQIAAELAVMLSLQDKVEEAMKEGATRGDYQAELSLMGLLLGRVHEDFPETCEDMAWAFLRFQIKELTDFMRAMFPEMGKDQKGEEFAREKGRAIRMHAELVEELEGLDSIDKSKDLYGVRVVRVKRIIKHLGDFAVLVTGLKLNSFESEFKMRFVSTVSRISCEADGCDLIGALGLCIAGTDFE